MIIAVAHFFAPGGPASGQLFAAFRATNKSSQREIQMVEHLVGLFVEAGDEFLKGIDDVSAVLGWEDDGFVFVITGLLVAERRAPAPSALLDRLFHAVGGAFTFDIVLKLREGADNIAHEFSDGIVIIGFGS